MKAYREWIRKLLGREREPEPETEAARRLAKQISERSDALTEHFLKYQKSRDPFEAMMSDVYNQGQMARMQRSIRK